MVRIFKRTTGLHFKNSQKSLTHSALRLRVILLGQQVTSLADPTKLIRAYISKSHYVINKFCHVSQCRRKILEHIPGFFQQMTVLMMNRYTFSTSFQFMMPKYSILNGDMAQTSSRRPTFISYSYKHCLYSYSSKICLFIVTNPDHSPIIKSCISNCQLDITTDCSISSNFRFYFQTYYFLFLN